MSIETEWLSINEAKRHAGCGKTSLYKAINGGLIEARRAFGRTLVSQSSIDAYIASCPHVGGRSAAQ